MHLNLLKLENPKRKEKLLETPEEFKSYLIDYIIKYLEYEEEDPNIDEIVNKLDFNRNSALVWFVEELIYLRELESDWDYPSQKWNITT